MHAVQPVSFYGNNPYGHTCTSGPLAGLRARPTTAEHFWWPLYSKHSMEDHTPEGQDVLPLLPSQEERNWGTVTSRVCLLVL